MKIKKDIMYGQEVTVTVYDSLKKPFLSTGRYMDEVMAADSNRLEQIKEEVEKYRQDSIEYELLRENMNSDFLSLEEVEVAEDDDLEAEGFGVIESFKPVDELLSEVNFEKEEDEQG
jgi:hypothetical protein